MALVPEVPLRAPLSARSSLLLLVLACDGGKEPVDEKSPKPTVQIVAPADGASFDEGTVVTFSAEVVDDAAPGALDVVWTSDRDGVLDETPPNDMGVATFSTADLSPGDHVVTVRVVDVDEQAAEDTVSITVVELHVEQDDPPTIDVVSPAAGDVAVAGEPFELAADVADEEEPPTDLVVAFLSDLDGDLCAPTPDAGGRAACTVTLTEGTHALTFAVADSAGQVATAAATLQVAAPGDPDEDGDGFTATEGDCDDADPEVRPDATEVCDGVDNDCDTLLDGADAEDAEVWYRDADADTYGDAAASVTDCEPPVGYVADATDCDDGNAARSPDTVWYRDGDADGYGDPDATQAQCERPAGFVADDTDCNDAAPSANPGATEACGGGDEDCDGTTDEDGATGCVDWYEDADGDGFGAGAPVCACEAADPFTATDADDCYDGNADARPGATVPASTDRGDGSYDYDCDGAETRQSLDLYACDGLDFACTSSRDGWVTSAVPACGVAETWGTGCQADATACSPETSSSQTQTCL